MFLQKLFKSRIFYIFLFGVYRWCHVLVLADVLALGSSVKDLADQGINKPQNSLFSIQTIFAT